MKIIYNFGNISGLRILAFPCNQFNGQEPGTADDICSFANREKVIVKKKFPLIFKKRNKIEKIYIIKCIQ